MTGGGMKTRVVETIDEFDMPPLATPGQVETLTQGEVLADDPGTTMMLNGVSRVIRQYCGWHITPVIEETLRVDVAYGGARLDVLIPSLRVLDVLEVRVDGRKVEHPSWTPDGHVWAGALAHGPHMVEVDVRHGHPAAEDLAAVVAQIIAIAQSSPTGVTREQAGAMSAAYALTGVGVSGGLTLMDRDRAILDAYRIGAQP